MFQNLQQNSQIYLLHKGEHLKLESGYVTSVIPASFSAGQYLPFQPPKLDITARFGDTTVTFQGLAGTANSADKDGDLVASSMDAVDAAIQSMRQDSIYALQMRAKHETRVQECDAILTQLHPEQAEKHQQQEQMNAMQGQINALQGTIAELTAALKAMKPETTTTTKKTEK